MNRHFYSDIDAETFHCSILDNRWSIHTRIWFSKNVFRASVWLLAAKGNSIFLISKEIVSKWILTITIDSPRRRYPSTALKMDLKAVNWFAKLVHIYTFKTYSKQIFITNALSFLILILSVSDVRDPFSCGWKGFNEFTGSAGIYFKIEMTWFVIWKIGRNAFYDYQSCNFRKRFGPLLD